MLFLEPFLHGGVWLKFLCSSVGELVVKYLLLLFKPVQFLLLNIIKSGLVSELCLQKQRNENDVEMR